MNNPTKCNECLETLPILFSGRMSSAERKKITGHLQSCEQCLQEFQRVKAIHLVIATNPGDADNIEELSPELLDTLVFDRESLSDVRLQEIESALSVSTGSRDIYQALREFPKPEEFAAATIRHERPAATRVSIIDIARQAFWNPMAGYAVAAVMAFILMYPMNSLNNRDYQDLGVGVIGAGAPYNLVPIELPLQTRSSTDAVPTFTASSSRFLALLTYPEYMMPGHSYDVEIVDHSTDLSLFYLRNIRQTDSEGRIQLIVPLDTGTYRMTIYDIEHFDTIPSGNIFKIVAE